MKQEIKHPRLRQPGEAQGPRGHEPAVRDDDQLRPLPAARADDPGRADREQGAGRAPWPRCGRRSRPGSRCRRRWPSTPKVFPPLMINMCRAGEVGGFLDAVLLQIADELRGRGQAPRQDQVGDDLPGRRLRDRHPRGRSACCCSSCRSSRRCSRTSAAAAAPTQILVFMSHGAALGPSRCSWWSASPRSITWGRVQAHRSGCARSSTRSSSRCRSSGSSSRRSRSAGSAATSARCSRSGVPILQCLDIVGGDQRQRRHAGRRPRRCRRACGAVSRWPARWPQHTVFPPMVVQMIAVGEDTGALDTMLDKIADFYDQEVEATTEALTSLIEPLMIAVLGGDHRSHDHRAVHADLQGLQPDQVGRRPAG